MAVKPDYPSSPSESNFIGKKILQLFANNPSTEVQTMRHEKLPIFFSTEEVSDVEAGMRPRPNSPANAYRHETTVKQPC